MVLVKSSLISTSSSSGYVRTTVPLSFASRPPHSRFHTVFGLRIELDYATVGAGMTPFTIAAIEREDVKDAMGHVSFRWRMPINWPDGVITFERSGFTQVLRRQPVLIDRQALLPHERRGA
jgi:hypothetical protein